MSHGQPGKFRKEISLIYGYLMIKKKKVPSYFIGLEEGSHFRFCQVRVFTRKIEQQPHETP